MQRRGIQLVRMFFLVLGSVVFLVPLFWMLSTALKPIDQTMSMPPRWMATSWLTEIDGAVVEVGVGTVPKQAGPDTAITVTTAYQWVTQIDGRAVPVRLIEQAEQGGPARVQARYHWELEDEGVRRPVRRIQREDAVLAPGQVDVAVVHPGGYMKRRVVSALELEKVSDTTREAVGRSYSFAEAFSVPAESLRKRYVPWNDRQWSAHVETQKRSVALGALEEKNAPRWDNFGGAIGEMKHFLRYLYNTLFLCVLTVIGTVVSSAFAAYGFSRIDWPGRDKVFWVVMGTMMIPFPVVMVPLYGMFKELGWIGTLKPLWVPAFFAGAFNIFLLRQFFRTIPRELSEAARIDGCSELRIFLQVVLPLAKPAITVVALFQFLYTWNDFLGPLIYLTDEKDYTLALALQSFQSKQGGTQWHYLMAASTLVVAPIIFLFFLTQRVFIEGVSMSGLKG